MASTWLRQRPGITAGGSARSRERRVEGASKPVASSSATSSARAGCHPRIQVGSGSARSHSRSVSGRCGANTGRDRGSGSSRLAKRISSPFAR